MAWNSPALHCTPSVASSTSCDPCITILCHFWPFFAASKAFGSQWGTCTSSCGCAKNRKTGCEWLPRWHRVSWVVWGPSDTVIFEREAVRALQKNAPVFEVLAMETVPRDSASPEDFSHVGALQVLVTALRSKRPSAWTLFTSWCCTCCREKSMWRARRQNLLRGSCDPASPYTPTSPIQFPVGLPSLQSAWSSRFWGWWWCTLVVQSTRWFRLPSLHILHVRCKFCAIHAVGKNLQFLHVWALLREKSIVHRDGQAQRRAQEKLERNRRWFERKKSTFLVRAANAPYGELHTSTNSRSLDHERGEHTTRRLWSGRGLGQSRTNLRRSKALRWSVRLSIVDTSFCAGPDSADILKTSLLACS